MPVSCGMPSRHAHQFPKSIRHGHRRNSPGNSLAVPHEPFMSKKTIFKRRPTCICSISHAQDNRGIVWMQIFIFPLFMLKYVLEAQSDVIGVACDGVDQFANLAKCAAR